MKKIICILLTITLIAATFVACSSSKSDKKATTSTTKSTSTTGITTDDATITEADAINLIESYTAKELGLSKENYEKCTFMVAQSGVKVRKAYYVKVVAAIKKEHTDDDGNKTYTFDNKGEYFIRYDGKQILQKDMDSEDEKYTEMKVKAVPTTQATTAETTKASKNAKTTTAKAAKTTTKK